MNATRAEAWVVVAPSARQTEELSAELVGEAQRLVGHGVVRALLVGHEVTGEGEALAKWGIDSVLAIDHPRLANYHPERFASVIACAISSHAVDAVLFAGTVLGTDLGGRVGIELGRRFHGGCLNFELVADGIKVTRPVSSGRQHQIEIASGAPFLLSLIPHTVGPGALGAMKSIDWRALEIDVPDTPTWLEDLGFTPADPRTMDIRDADIIVSGGRGVGSSEGFDLLAEIADHLGGSLAASRPAVEAGWAAYERQVGQTGRSVRPKLYLACGISGAPQHLAGMREAETIIAINVDPGAPILEVAHLGIEADLHEVLGALAARLRSHRKGVA